MLNSGLYKPGRALGEKVGNNKLVAVFPDDANVGQAPGGRPAIILFDGMREDFLIVELCC